MLFDDKQFENEEYWEYATIPPEYDVATISEETEMVLFVEEQSEKLEL